MQEEKTRDFHKAVTTNVAGQTVYQWTEIFICSIYSNTTCDDPPRTCDQL